MNLFAAERIYGGYSAAYEFEDTAAANYNWKSYIQNKLNSSKSYKEDDYGKMNIFYENYKFEKYEEQFFATIVQKRLNQGKKITVTFNNPYSSENNGEASRCIHRINPHWYSLSIFVNGIKRKMNKGKRIYVCIEDNYSNEKKNVKKNLFNDEYVTLRAQKRTTRLAWRQALV